MPHSMDMSMPPTRCPGGGRRSGMRSPPAGSAVSRSHSTPPGIEESCTAMSRPGFVLEVDERTPPLLVHSGEAFQLEQFPLGTRVVYPPDSLPGIRDIDAAIAEALLNPLGRK